ncbi:MAG: enoyl-CoA hydratase-related protein [Actinomycetota bacterium]|nr:enoyl-CoA hydratase-related protein [Actinomycetota bacterium]MDA8207500.1 enoyl-CoA hydratase-related protein [Actinomycetota bacterium]
MSGRVTTRVSGAVGEIVISNADHKNAMTSEMWRQLRSAAEEMRANDYVRVVVIHGAEGTFVAGADIDEFRTMRQAGDTAVEYDRITEDALVALATMPKPTVAAIEGYCIGGGVSIAVACDFQVADARAKFQIPAAKLGISYPLGSLRRLVAQVGASAAKRMIFTASMLDAGAALDAGLISQVSESLTDSIAELTVALTEVAPLSIAATKALADGLVNPAADYAALEEEAARLSAATIASADYLEALDAFDDKRKPNFQGR